MKIYKPNICFLALDEIEEKIVLNDFSNIIFSNHGKKVLRNETGFSKNDGTLFASVDDGEIYEIIIETQSDNNADEIIDLFNSCLAIVQGAPSYELDQLIINIHYSQNNAFSCYPTYSFDGNNAAYLACNILKNVFNDDRLKTAVLKFNIAQEIFYLHPLDLTPFNDTYDYQYLLSSQIKMGYSIIVCYSILEELNIQVKASKDNPSSIDGKWNPDVISELQGRLSAKGLNPNKKIPWLSRSTRNRPFKKEIKNKDLCEWSDGYNVKDFEIDMTEAILETSFIRSQIASHANSKKVVELCLYDVENTNMLIRNILKDFLS